MYNTGQFDEAYHGPTDVMNSLIRGSYVHHHPPPFPAVYPIPSIAYPRLSFNTTNGGPPCNTIQYRGQYDERYFKTWTQFISFHHSTKIFILGLVQIVVEPGGGSNAL